MKKRYKNQGIPEFMNPSKMSFFRSSNNLNSSSENIRINEEEPILNENKQPANNMLKSEMT